MIDRFKFRVWNKPGNSYISAKDDADFVYLEENGKITVGLYNGDEEDMLYLKEEDLIVEQCTGLKDKNGRLIYEGDIIELYRGKSNIHQKKGKRFEVKFLTHRFCGFGFGYVDCPSVDMALTESKAKICRVIGNIHENPELLEQTNER